MHIIKIPSAILYYEKAKKLKPNDERINFNLAIANRKVLDKIDTVPELFIWTWWRSFYDLLTEKNWAILSICCFALVFIFLIFYLLSQSIRIRKISFWLSTLMLVVTLVSVLNAYMQFKNITNEKEAIIFSPTVTVKSSPDANSVDLFVLHEGTKVKIHDNINEWYEIKIADGSDGWIEAQHLRKI